ncbi:MAG: VIT1/CCC1 transporter family protein [Antarcticimicrobium sp.]|uniref:VIT1/CCC1 transporter family protein n=1 Tax=Antarcticimicrobium sp. TaxID=2824147 RepID=UPI00260A7A3F|nr:VIT1/CCC1 transporter family protein [Antarcticimicrobium sp.]MDF1717270.1 VIT1/CCC1 transporter family protein [Antarcticimicrobium sp.]
MQDHGHSHEEIAARVGAPQGRGHLRDVVYGAIDGSVTTFAIVAGVAGAGLSPFVIVALGLANVLADGFSMAAGNFSGTKAELDDIQRLRQVEERHIARYPDGERQEVREILARKGLSGRVLEEATEEICGDRENWIQLMLEGEYGLAGVDPHPMRAALATFAAFLVAGMVPLMPFVLGLEGAFALSSWMTGGVFFAIGALKSRWSLAPWWRSGLETLAIGGVAAGLAYVVGTLFSM